MKQKIMLFTDTGGGSLTRVYSGIEKQLSGEFEFRWLDWRNYTYDSFMEVFNWSDICVTNLVAINHMNTWYGLDLRKFLLISHSADEHDWSNANGYDPRPTYGLTSNCVRELYPPNMKLHRMSNGVDHNDFTYTPRSGSLNTIGWCGRRCLPSKQVEWAEDISKRTGIPLDNLDASLSETRPKDFMRGWYQNIDLLIVTAIPVWNSETGPLPTFEAIVSGIPAIGTPVGNFRDVPGPKFTTVDEAVTLVNELRQTPDRMKALALEQYNYVMAHYTYEVIAKSWRVGIQDAILRSSFQN